MQTLERITTIQVEIAGTPLPGGSRVKVCLGAANRDPQRFPNPDDFLLMRNPRDHLAFGAGPYRYLGERLTHLETQMALQALLTELPPLHAAQPLDHLQYVRSIFVSELQHLRVACE